MMLLIKRIYLKSCINGVILLKLTPLKQTMINEMKKMNKKINFDNRFNSFSNLLIFERGCSEFICILDSFPVYITSPF